MAFTVAPAFSHLDVRTAAQIFRAKRYILTFEKGSASEAAVLRKVNRGTFRSSKLLSSLQYREFL